jgi:AraC family transcriptional activator of pobA
MQHFCTISDLHRVNGFPRPENPMIGLIRFDRGFPCLKGANRFTTDFFMISFSKVKSGSIKHDGSMYPHEYGSLYFAGPGQVFAMECLEMEGNGFAIYFQEDSLAGHRLQQKIKDFSYFYNDHSEALHLFHVEEEMVCDLFQLIESEYYNNQDEYSMDIMLNYVESILHYSLRFFKRKFNNASIVS